MEDRIIIRSVFKITKCYMEPAKDPKTNRFPDSVREVNSQGDMILSEADRRSGKFFVKSTDVIEITDGKEFNLEDPIDEAQWDSIKYSKRIAQARTEKDILGNLTIDGNALRYGTAEFYIEHPGQETKQKVNRKLIIHKAIGFIFGDSAEGLYQKVRILGHEMKGSTLSDVQDYLHAIAEKDPEKVIDLYTGGDTQLRIFLLDAIDKNVILNRNGLFYYADTILGSADAAVINWFKQPTNKTMVNIIKAEVYPDLILRNYAVKETPAKEEEMEILPEKSSETEPPKSTTKK